jgi:2-phosphoglycerate kinase
MIDFLRKQNPKEFHKNFSKRKTQTKNIISLNQFVEHFKDLSRSNDNSINNATMDFDGYMSYEELGIAITENEIVKAIGHLKRNTSCGEDYLLNDFSRIVKTLLYHFY